MKTLVLMLLAVPGALLAQSSAIDWQSLPKYEGRSARATLADGSRVSGRLTALTDHSVTLSGPSREVARTDLKILVVKRTTIRWRIVGTAAGAVLGFAAAVGTDVAIHGVGPSFDPNHHENPAGPIAVGAVVTAAGFLIGWRADQHWTAVNLH